jgi:serine/threonine-protein kinase
MVGKTLSHYKIIGKLGEGGMGVVYKAEDTKLERMVALKFLPSHLAASEQDKARFIQEAKAASAINHPNICTIYDIDEHDGQMFIAMEFVDGQTLREKKDAVSFKQAVEIGIQISDGLAAAHEKGIVHRDIKPENIMIRKDGIAQIMDFGLAKLRSSSSTIKRLTKEGSTVGTAGYMSPEQIQGQDADHRSDVFSLGVLLFELFTKQLPFKGVHETAIAYEIVNVEAPPMSSMNAEIDTELDRIVYECLQKDPEERYQSVKEISRDLKRFRRESSKARMSRTYPVQSSLRSAATLSVDAGSARSASVRGFSKLLLWQIIAAVALLAAIGVLWQTRNKGDHRVLPITRFTTKLPDDLPIPIGFTGVDIAPDGKFMAFDVLSGTGVKLVLRPADREVFEPVLGSAGIFGGFLYHMFSPDGQWIAFTAGSSIKKSSVFGGTPVVVCDAGAPPRGLWWGSDQHIYYGHINGPINRVSENGGMVTAVTTLDSASGEISHRFPALLPDGKSVLYTIKFNTITTFDEAAIAVRDMISGKTKVLIRGGTYGRYVPTGHLIYARGSYIYAVPFDLGKLELTGPPKELFKGGWMNPFSGEVNLAFSNSGTLLYVPRGIESYTLSQVKWIDAGGKIAPLVDSANSYSGAVLSPDGEKVALHVNGANDDVWLYHVARKSLTRLTFGGGNNGFPVWSPDGRYLIYASERGKGQSIYRKQWDGSGEEERLTTSVRSQYPRAVTPDGKTLAFVQDGDIWLLALDGSGKTSPFVESPANESSPVFSPDGRYMAYESDASGRQEIVVVSFPSRGGKWQISAGGGANPIWSPTGRELYYSQEGSIFGVTIPSGSAFDYSAPRKLFDLPPDAASVVGISSNGKQFVMVTIPSKQLSTTEVTLVTDWFQELNNVFTGK